MGHMLLWIEGLAAMLLLVAWVTAVAARRRHRGVQRALPITAALLVFGVAVLAVVGAYALRYITLCRPNLVLYTASWAVVFAAGAVAVLARGLRTRDDERAAKAWPAGRLGVALAAVIALDMMTLWNMDLAARNYLTAQRAEAGALALSVAPARVPDRANAALVYQQAADAMKSLDDELGEKVTTERRESKAGQPEGPWSRVSGWLREPGSPEVDLASPELREHLRQGAPVLVLVRRAAAMPDCYFERDWGRPSPDMLLPEYDGLRRASRRLMLEARCRAADGDAAGAVADVSAMFQMAGHTRTEAILVGLLVAMMMDDMAASALEAVVATGQVQPADLAALAFDDTVAYQRCLARALRMEEAFGLGCFAMLGEGGSPALMLELMGETRTFLWWPVAVVWRVFIMPEDLASYRDTLHTFQTQAAFPYHQAVGEHEDIERLVETGQLGVLTRMLVPALSKCAERAAESDARHRLAQTALAAMAWRGKHGRMPTALEDLAPEVLPRVPIDPFDGRPLRKTTRDGKVVLYSIGPDLKDDGGAAWENETRTGDLTFRLPGD